MADQYYRKPEIDGVKPINLVPEHGKGTVLKPDTPVLCINRGIRAIHDKWDGIDYIIPPGYFEVAYGAADHFRNRAVVPGSRNPETGKQESFIGLVGIDRPERCEPFTPEQCEAFGLRVEAIAREELTSPEARAVVTVDTRSVQARMVGGRRVKLPPTADVHSKADREAAREILAPPEVSEAQQEIAAAEAELGR